MNIAQLLVRAARAFPHRIAIASGFAPHATYGELARRAAAIAHYLSSTLRLPPGERVALYMPNCPAYLEVLAGIWWAGLTVVPVNAKLDGREFAAILDHATASCCFVGSAGVEASVQAIGESRTIDISSSRYIQIVQSDREASIAWNVPDDLAWLFYLGGAAGKGVMLSHRNLMTMTLCYFADVDAQCGEASVIHATPLSDAAGLYALPHIAAASTHVMTSGDFDPGELIDLAQHWHHARLFATPKLVKRLVDAVRTTQVDIGQIETIVCGGPLSQADMLEALSIMGQKFVPIYGLPESSMTIAALSRFHLGDTSNPRYAARCRSVGVPQTAVEVRVVDSADRPPPAGQPGEILVRGDAVMRGYWMNPRATADALRGGWLHTGDIGVIDADGFLTLVQPV
jgi:long-chain acyl-CoA synthetase